MRWESGLEWRMTTDLWVVIVFMVLPNEALTKKSTKASQKPDIILSDSADCSELWSQLL